MLYPDFEKDKDYLFMKFQKPVFNPATGISQEEIVEQVTALAAELDMYITRALRIAE